MNIETKIKEEAIHWLTCENEGLDENQKGEFKNWLKEPTHQKAYNRMKFVHQMAQTLSKENAQKLSSRTHHQIRKEKFLKKISYFSSAAAIVLIVCFSAFKLYNNTFAVQFSKTLVTDTKNLIKEQLPDGSSLSLDAKTNLNIEFFNGKREVILKEGRVMFEVAKDENRPFVIKSDDINIEVVGTKFEVIHKKDTTTINVEEGIVKTYYSSYFFDKQNEMMLTKENSITYLNKQGMIATQGKVNPKKIALWRENRIHLDNTTLKEALEEFSKYKTISVSFLSKEAENYTVSGEFFSTQLEIFLKTVTKLYPIKIEKKEKVLKISKKI